MLRTLVARLSRDLGARFLRLAERLATGPDQASAHRRRAEALLRKRCPDAPEHWIQLVAARSHGFATYRAGGAPDRGARHTPQPEPISRPMPEPISAPPPSSAPAFMTNRDGSREPAAPDQATAELPAPPMRRGSMIEPASDTPARPMPASTPQWPAGGTPRGEAAAAFRPGEGRRRPMLTVVESPPRERPAPAPPRWTDPCVSARNDAAPAPFAVAAGSRGRRPAFVEVMARSEQPSPAVGLAWPRPEHRFVPPPGPAWPAPARSPAAPVLPAAASPRRGPAEAAIPEPQPDSAATWPELPLPLDRHGSPRTEPHAISYRERLARLARDQERL